MTFRRLTRGAQAVHADLFDLVAVRRLGVRVVPAVLARQALHAGLGALVARGLPRGGTAVEPAWRGN